MSTNNFDNDADFVLIYVCIQYAHSVFFIRPPNGEAFKSAFLWDSTKNLYKKVRHDLIIRC